MSDRLNKKTLDCLRLTTIQLDNPERLVEYQHLAQVYSEKAVIAKLKQMSRKGWCDYGVSAPYAWITDQGLAVLKDNDRRMSKNIGYIDCPDCGAEVIACSNNVYLNSTAVPWDGQRSRTLIAVGTSLFAIHSPEGLQYTLHAHQPNVFEYPEDRCP